jgi:hypothetical protein
VIGGEEMEAVREEILGSVSETILRFARDDAGLEQVGEIAVEGDLSETDDDADAWQGLDLSGEVRGAVAEFQRKRLVAGWGAANDRGYPRVTELEAVVAGDGQRSGGEAEFVEDGVHEVPGAVAGKGTASAIGSVGTGGETEDEDAGARVSKARNGTAPVGLVLIGATFGLGDAAAVGSKTRAALAGDD